MTAETQIFQNENAFAKEAALVQSARFFDQISPYRSQLPQFVYVESYSCCYGTSSQYDWLLQVIQYDSRFHRLVETTVQFALVDEKSESFIHLPEPAFLHVNVMKADAWLTYSDEIYQALVGAVVSVREGKPVESPKHKATGHPLLPSFVLGPCYPKK
jgi:hypothetical protein